MNVRADSLLGRRMSRTDTLIGKSPRMLDGIRVLGRAVDVQGNAVLTADGGRVCQPLWCGRPASGPTSDGSRPPCSTRTAPLCTGGV